MAVEPLTPQNPSATLSAQAVRFERPTMVVSAAEAAVRSGLADDGHQLLIRLRAGLSAAVLEAELGGEGDVLVDLGAVTGERTEVVFAGLDIFEEGVL